jgi:predicted metal-binding protein
MSTSTNNLIDEVLSLNVAHAVVIDASIIEYSSEFRVYCEQNKCGAYGRNWMCPPAAGSFEKLVTRASQYDKGLVFQTVHKISRPSDFKGMLDAMKVHEDIVREVARRFVELTGLEEILPLGAGACRFCEECAYPSGEPCRFPDKAVASVESYGIDVARLVKSCEIPYRYGKDTVAYVGCILFRNDLP